MKNLDWRTIINKVINWGFPATLSILGIVLMAGGKTFSDGNSTNKIIFLVLGAVIALSGLIMYGFLQVHANDNSKREETISELKREVEELKGEITRQTEKIIDLTAQVQTLKTELDRKQAKIDKLTQENKKS